jgi:hypothetical protein
MSYRRIDGDVVSSISDLDDYDRQYSTAFGFIRLLGSAQLKSFTIPRSTGATPRRPTRAGEIESAA